MNKVLYKIIHKVLFTLIVLIISGCSTIPHDPTLVPNVKRLGGDMYSVSEMNTMFGDPAELAVQQCLLDGNKKISNLTHSTRTGAYSGTIYTVLIFTCE